MSMRRMTTMRALGVILLTMPAVFSMVWAGEGAMNGEAPPAPPVPYDGAANVSPDGLILSWAAVSNAGSYEVWFGTAPDSLAVQGSTTQPGWTVTTALARGKSYFWRVNTRRSGAAPSVGPVWRFSVVPPSPKDTSLLAWYAFDEAVGAVSRSLTANASEIDVENMTWGSAASPGVDGASVQSDGVGWAYLVIPSTAQPIARMTLSGWFYIRGRNEPAALWSIGSGAGSYISLVTHSATSRSPFIEVMSADRNQPARSPGKVPLPLDRWTHLTVLIDPPAQQIAVYEDGAIAWTAGGLTNLATILKEAHTVFLGASFVLDSCLRGGVDDVRLYTRLLDSQEIARAMLGHPDSPYEPGPGRWAQVHVTVPAMLRWQGSAEATQYNLYTGSVSSNLSLVARDLTQPEYLLKPAPAGGQTLYWQVEAVLKDGFVRSPVWQFSVTSQSLFDAIAQATPWWADYTTYYRQIAPDISLADTKGAGHRLRDYRGRDLLVVVWAPWCSRSRAEMAELVSLRKAAGEDELALVTITDESTRDDAAAFLVGRPDITFPVCVTKTASLPAPFSSVLHFPSIFYIAPDGTIKLGTVGPVPRAKIEAIIASGWPYKP